MTSPYWFDACVYASDLNDDVFKFSISVSSTSCFAAVYLPHKFLKTQAELKNYYESIKKQSRNSKHQVLLGLELDKDVTVDDIESIASFNLSLGESCVAYLHYDTRIENQDNHCFKLLNAKEIFSKMQEKGLALSVLAYDLDPKIRPQDKEKSFIKKYLGPIAQAYPRLKILLQECSSSSALDFVLSHENVYGTLSYAHLLLDLDLLEIKDQRRAESILKNDYPLICPHAIYQKMNARKKMIQILKSGTHKFFAASCRDLFKNTDKFNQNVELRPKGIFTQTPYAFYEAALSRPLSKYAFENFMFRNAASFFSFMLPEEGLERMKMGDSQNDDFADAGPFLTGLLETLRKSSES